LPGKGNIFQFILLSIGNRSEEQATAIASNLLAPETWSFFGEWCPTYSVETTSTYGINSIISKLMKFIENVETG
jgi:hypothetical protein